jgi:hypothetical protein
LKLVDDNGTAWSLSLTDGRTGSQFSISVPAMGSIRLISTGAGQTTQTGWASLDSQADLSGVATFDYRSGSSLLDSIGVVGTQSGSRYILPLDTSLTADAGFAIVNTGTSNLSIRTTLRAENGSVVSSVLDLRLNPLLAQRHLALFASQIFPSLQSGSFKGSLLIEVVGAGSIAIVGLSYKEGQFSVVPNIALEQVGSASQQKAQQLFGRWTFTYTVGSQWTDSYNLTTLTQDTDDPTQWYAAGTSLDDGNPALGGWNTDLGQYLMIHPNSVFIDAYVFDFTNTNAASGCYYLYYFDGTISRCYSLTGSRTSTAQSQSATFTRRPQSDVIKLVESQSIDSSDVAEPESFLLRRELDKLKSLGRRAADR